MAISGPLGVIAKLFGHLRDTWRLKTTFWAMFTMSTHMSTNAPATTAKAHASAGFSPEMVQAVAQRARVPLVIRDYDPRSVDKYEAIAKRVNDALGTLRATIHHVGSTSIPGLPAKPIIDVDVTLACDLADEHLYAPLLADAGFKLVLRQPSWHQNRLFECTEPTHVNLHIFPAGCAEVERHLAFRDWLRDEDHEADREAYVAAKRAAVEECRRTAGDGRAYNAKKAPVLREILARALRGSGRTDLLDD